MESRERDRPAKPPSMEAADRPLGQRVDRVSAGRSGGARRSHAADVSRVGETYQV